MSVLSSSIGASCAEPAAKSAAQTQIDDLYTKWMVITALFFVALEIAYLAVAGLPPLDWPWLDGTNFVIGRDFLNTWMGGRSAFFGGPAPWFDYHVYNDVLTGVLHGPHPEIYWSYPPHVVLFTWPFGLMPYVPAYIAWCLIGIALYLRACSGVIASERTAFLVIAPGVAMCILFGQNGFYTAALLIGGLLNLDRRPVLAGVLFGILTVKPQLGLLLPVLLLLQRRWLTIAAATTTAAVLVIATAMLFGWSVWPEYLQKVVPQQAWLTENSGGLLYVIVGSVFYGGRLLHLPLRADWILQYIVTAMTVAALIWTYWKRRDPALSLAFFIAAIFLVTPYILNYDMVVLGFVVALLRDRADNTKADHRLLLAVWTLPITMMLVGFASIPLAPVVMIAFAGRLLWRLAHPGDVSQRPSESRAEIAAAASAI